MKENTEKTYVPALRNIDVINGISERCREISLTASEIDTLGEMKNQDLFEIAASEEKSLVESVISELSKIAFLLKKLSDGYINQLSETDFCLDEFMNYTDRIDYSKEILLREWDSILDEVWSLAAFCDTELTHYKAMIQPCGVNEFVQIVFEGA